MTRKEHEPLARSPLVEVVFELRYVAAVSSSEVRTRLLEQLTMFKNEEFLNTQQVVFEVKSDEIRKIPLDEEPIDLIQHRYRDSETNSFLQFGNGIISFNVLQYSRFTDFFDTAHLILSSLHEMQVLSAYRGLSLRYINHFELQQNPNPERVFAWLAPMPKAWNATLPIQNLQQTVLRSGEDLQIVTIAYPQTNQQAKMVMVFDIQHRIDFVLPVEPNLQQIHNWLYEAHDKVSETFQGALRPDFYEELK